MTSLDPATWDTDELEAHYAASDGDKPRVAGRSWAVTAEHPLVTLAGEKALDAGGSAADAVVAMCAMLHVVMPGTTSLGGILGGVYHDGPTGVTKSLNGGSTTPLEDGAFGTPVDPYDHVRHSGSGRSVMVWGAPRALEDLHARHGSLPWTEVWKPAIHVARYGFPAYELYVRNLVRREAVLRKHPGGIANYLPNGLPEVGAPLVQAPLADTLEAIATDGADVMYSGAWAQEALALLRANGSRLTEADLAAYRPRWDAPLVGSYRGVEIRTVQPPMYAGANLLLGLQVADELALHERPAADASALYDAISIFRYTMLVPEFMVDAVAEGPAAVAGIAAALDGGRAKLLADAIRGSRVEAPSVVGTHSHNVVVTDAQGSTFSGVFTIHSDSWGDPGLVVGGISLNSAAHSLLTHRPPAGARLCEPLASYVAFDGDRQVLASSVIGSGLMGCQLQTTVDVLGRGLDAHTVAAQPRFGFNELDIATFTMSDRIQVEPFGDAVLDEVEALGQPLARKTYRWEGHGYADTGYWAAIRTGADGTMQAVTDPRLPGKAVAR